LILIEAFSGNLEGFVTIQIGTPQWENRQGGIAAIPRKVPVEITLAMGSTKTGYKSNPFC